MITQITSASKDESSLIPQHIIQRGKCWCSTVYQGTILGAGNSETSVAKPLPWRSGPPNDPPLHILAGGCDFRLGRTPKKILGVGRRAPEPPCSLTKHCYSLFFVLQPIHLYLVLSTNCPASRKIAPTDNGSKLLWSYIPAPRARTPYLFGKRHRVSHKRHEQLNSSSVLEFGLKCLQWTHGQEPNLQESQQFILLKLGFRTLEDCSCLKGVSPTKYHFLHGACVLHGLQWVPLLTTQSGSSRPYLQSQGCLVHPSSAPALPLNIPLLGSTRTGCPAFPCRHRASSLLAWLKIPTPFYPCYFSRPSRSLVSSRKLATALQPLLAFTCVIQNHSVIRSAVSSLRAGTTWFATLPPPPLAQ